MQLQDESLAEIATFLARRWSGEGMIAVEISERSETKTRLGEKIIIAPPGKRMGGGFERYRQFRTSLWYESMRASLCKKILSNDHAFGFILNSMETRRIERLGRQVWRGMDAEIIFNYAFMFLSRPQLGTVYGRARIVEAFYQHFMFGAIKGEIQSSHFERVKKASALAEEAVFRAVRDGSGTEWLEERAAEIVKILEIDSLLTIPVSLPFSRAGMAADQKELQRALGTVSKNKEADFGKVNADSVRGGEDVYGEYMVLLEEDKKAENKGLAPEPVGVRTPSAGDASEAAIYDMSLINGLKLKFKEWKSGWKETHSASGDEFDGEGYIEGYGPFLVDVKKSIRTKIVILLDHSSSIASDALEYKKATLALCEVLAFLKVRFAVYAFSTQGREVVCWSIKPAGAKWNRIAARRLARVVANGSTPLAEVYDKMFPILQSGRPDIFLTLTDGEPSDPDAVRAMVKSLKRLGISMAALGLGPNTLRATAIAGNLRHLGYERTVAAGRLGDIPGRVMGILQV
ncbi:MAG: VWA domain-containing protein [Nitrosopumilus sp. H8]|nr:MAG: VWA domain-containing protein [Nitrosopumilus sp. H8]